MPRKFPRKIKRVVIKIGSSVIATYKMKPRIAQLRHLVEQVISVQKKGVEVVMVSSGAIVWGMGEMSLKSRPSDLANLQALAAVGQTVLMGRYTELFKKNKGRCAQVLLTWDDFDDRKRYNNAKNTFEAMLENGITPIVNENDTISTDEIKFGDNDKLSALVASSIGADLLLILSDVEGLYDTNSKDKKLFQEIKEITKEIEGLASGTNKAKKNMSKGGMIGKLEAVKVATHAKVPCVIAHGEVKDVLLRVLSGERIGTFFMEREEKLIAKKHWISFGAKPKGVLTIDDGAKKALLEGGKSLLLPGVTVWEGHFKKEDIVIVQDQQKHEIARGIINYSSTELNKIEDRKGKTEAIHRDDLVLNKR
ncbi:MAG: glutamate 5-kinase [Candidatus Omnitrophica bacterium]|nr:glutamate 5-kinase [Candidatus Omnitrophota bacterium]